MPMSTILVGDPIEYIQVQSSRRSMHNTAVIKIQFGSDL